jgi:hypothetical protein
MTATTKIFLGSMPLFSAYQVLRRVESMPMGDLQVERSDQLR